MIAGELSERAQSLLKTLVECYIRDGQPVGSRTLARSSELELSPATVRNVLADLEELGLVSAPHTSAGRVPTALGYRVFVNSLLTVQALDNEEVSALRRQLDPQNTVPDLLERASKLLSGVTHMAGLVTVPRRGITLLDHVEFLTLSSERILAIFVFDDREVQNHIIHTVRSYSAEELQQVAHYLNTHYVGKALDDAKQALLQSMREVKETVTSLLQATVTAAEHMVHREAQPGDYVLAGQTNLMGFAEFSNLDRLRQLFDAFAEKRDMLYLLDQCTASGGVQIFIGDESGYKVFDDCSVVTAPYQREGRPAGVLGVIGPTRMAYERVIPVVDVTAKLLGAALNSRH